MIDTRKFEVEVDDREPSDTLQRVKVFFPKAKKARLNVGDIVYKGTAIELKSWSDFIKAITDKEDKRYRNQLFNFYINPEIDAYYFIYGDWEEIDKYSMIKMQAILGAIASALGRYNVKTCIFPNKEYATYVACKIIEKAHDRKEIRPETFRVSTDDRALNMIMEGAERFQEKAAIKALQKFGNVRSVVNSDIKELMKIKGIGDTIATRFFETINYDFKQKKEFNEILDIELIDEEADKIKDSEKIDDDRGKELVYKAIHMYCHEKKKDCSLVRLIKALPKLDSQKIKQYIQDLEIESRIYQADKEMYNVY